MINITRKRSRQVSDPVGLYYVLFGRYVPYHVGNNADDPMKLKCLFALTGCKVED